MTKTLNQIFFSLLQNQNIFFRKKNINGRSLNLFIEVLLLVRLNLFIEVLLLVKLNLFIEVLLLVKLNLFIEVLLLVRLNLFIEVLLLVRLNLFIEVLLLVRLNLLQVLLLVRLNLLQDFGTEIFLKKIHKSIWETIWGSLKINTKLLDILVYLVCRKLVYYFWCIFIDYSLKLVQDFSFSTAFQIGFIYFSVIF
jgi:hypothetical protein